MNDPIAITLRVIIGALSAAGVLSVSLCVLAGVLPGGVAVAYCLAFLFAGAVAVLGL